MSKPFVAILMGSESDLSIMQAGADILKHIGNRLRDKNYFCSPHPGSDPAIHK